MHFITTLAIAWLISVVPFSYNFINQHQQIKKAFASDSAFLNKQDQAAFKIAQDIKTSLANHPEWHRKGQKYFIIGLHDFEKLRLMHHLIELNIAITSKIDYLSTNKHIRRHLFIMVNENKKYCSKRRYLRSLGRKGRILEMSENYCILRIK